MELGGEVACPYSARNCAIGLEMTRRYVHLAKSDLRAAHKRFAPGDRMLQ